MTGLSGKNFKQIRFKGQKLFVIYKNLKNSLDCQEMIGFFILAVQSMVKIICLSIYF